MQYICIMEIDKGFFIYLLNHNPTPDLVSHLDRMACGCKYVHHWVFNMQMGRWNPMVVELDYELKDVKSISQLFDFLQKHEIQKQPGSAESLG